MRLVVIAVLLAAAPAVAKPLPKTTKIALVKGALSITVDAVTVPLVDDTRVDIEKLVSSELSDDGKTYVVKTIRCDGQDSETDASVTVIAARVENVLGMQQHLKKKYADAIPHFVAASDGDPDAAVYATNLLSAQSMSGKLDDADKTLAKYGPRNRAWFVWRLLVDPELDKVKGRAAATALSATKPGTLKFADLGYDHAGASPSVHLGAALVGDFDGGPGSPDGRSLQIVDYDGHQLLRLPVVELADGCSPDASNQIVPGCSKATKATIAAREKVANQVLATLGFDGTAYAAATSDTSKSPDGKTSYTIDDAGKIRVSRGKASKLYDDTGRGSEWQVYFLPDAVLVKYRERHVITCDDDSGRLYARAFAAP